MKPKRKKRGGRPRTQNVPREANGRVSRTYQREEKSPRRVALEARVRVFGLSEKDASHYMAGSVVGRLTLSGALSRDQYDAAMKYSETRNAYLRAIGAKQDYTEPPPEVEGDGDYEAFCRRARERFAAMRYALNDLCVEQRSPAPMSALDVIVNRDVYVPELEGALRLALNKLARHFFGIDEKQAPQKD